jgi:mono/diheme cytochrome c family protein
MLKSIWTYMALALLAMGVWFVFLAPAQQMVGHDMTPPDTSSAQQGRPLAEVVLPATLSQNAQIGKNVFEGACASCHGINAAGQNGIAPPLVHRIYEPSHHGDQAFLNAAQNGVSSHHWEFGNMPPVEGLTRAEVIYIVSYVRELQQANGIR